MKANKGRRGFTYTHKPMTAANVRAVRAANVGGFTVNVSANNPAEASRVKKRFGLPTVTLLTKGAPKTQTVDGQLIVRCPATFSGITCAQCGICARADRRFIVGFPVHGTQAKAAGMVAEGGKACQG